MNVKPSLGTLLRDWRKRRGLSQMSLSLDAGISQRHLSFLETGRAQPSRDLVMRLGDEMALSLRDRNALLLSAGFAPLYQERSFDAPEMATARAAVESVIAGQYPHPALAIDRHWNMLAANEAVGVLLEGLPDTTTAPPVNVLRLSLHPKGLAPRIQNFGEWRAHILARLKHQVSASADIELAHLYDELKAYPMPPGSRVEARRVSANEIVVPLRMMSRAGPLHFISTTTVFGTAVDVTMSEIAIETFFPADAATSDAMRRLLSAV